MFSATFCNWGSLTQLPAGYTRDRIHERSFVTSVEASFK